MKQREYLELASVRKGWCRDREGRKRSEEGKGMGKVRELEAERGGEEGRK